MKPIKFRAWDKVQRRMKTVVMLEWNMDYPEILERVDTYPVCCYQRRSDAIHLLDSIELMEYTGIKDSLGQEIYENDIVRYEANDGEADDIIIAVVKFDDDENETSTISGFKLEYCDRDSRGEDEFEEGIFQKLGNIYENSDLISE